MAIIKLATLCESASAKWHIKPMAIMLANSNTTSIVEMNILLWKINIVFKSIATKPF